MLLDKTVKFIFRPFMMQTYKQFVNKAKEDGGKLKSGIYKLFDVDVFTQQLYQLTAKKGFLVKRLGNVKSDPVLLLIPKELKNGPNILIAAGFHGEEPAGCFGILHFLETMPQRFISKANISFLPMVNPTGFRSRKRTNAWNENPNKGFCHTNSGNPEPSHEGLILMKHLHLLKSLANDGFISLHEDVEQERFYLYTFENTNTTGPFSEVLRTEEAKFFMPYPDGELEGGSVRNGIIFRHCDGSFEDLLFHEGIHRTACTETPGLSDIEKRIEANASIITAFVRFAVDMHDYS